MTADWSKSGVDLHLETLPEGGRRAGLEDALRAAIVDGRLQAGDRVPPSRELAAELGVARGTVTAAYQQLVAEGYLTARHGAGTRVADVPDTSLPRPDQAAAAPTPPPVRHDLMPGRSDTAAFPRDQWVRATRRVLAELPAAELVPSSMNGVRQLREALVAYLGRTRGVRTHPDRVLITTGFMQSLSVLAHCLPGDRPIAMEDPCLHFHRHVVRRAARDVVPLAVDDAGASDHVPDEAGAVVVTPAHQAVLGIVMAPHRRRGLVEWAHTHDGIVIEDDYDGEFRYDQQPIGALQAMAPDRVAYVGTTSKTLSAGLRLGWVVLPEQLVGPAIEAKLLIDGPTAVLGQHVLAELITSHAYDRHIRTQRIQYRRRRDHLITRLQRAVPSVRVRGAAAGLQVLLELPPDGPTAAEVERAATARGIRVATGDLCWHSSDQGGAADHRHAISVGYGSPPEHGFQTAIDAFIHVLSEILPHQRTARSLLD